MSILINKILSKLGIESKRTLNIIKHIIVSFFFKVGAILANFMLVPLTISYLGTENYGVWLTLSSFIAWFSFFDIGLGNGLRNKLTEAYTTNKIKLARGYVSTAYFTIISISSFLFLIFSFVNHFVDWDIIFNTNSNLGEDLSLLMPIIAGCFCLQLVFKLIGNVYLANQNHSIQVKIHFFVQVLSVIIIWFIIKTSNKSSLLIFGSIFSVIPLLVLLSYNALGFSQDFKDVAPTIKLWKVKHLKNIMGMGFDFFIIQLSGVILFSTDNFIISKVFSPEDVVPYNIAFKYFSIITMAFNLIMMPYWSSTTEAFVNKEYNWIKKSIKSILKVWLFIPISLGILLVISDWLYNFWVGQKVSVPFLLSCSMAIYVLLFTFNMIFNFFINGVGKIKIQMLISLISIIINIPLSIFFAEELSFGVSGVILATTVSILISAILSPIQYYKIINFKATGLWNK